MRRNVPGRNERPDRMVEEDTIGPELRMVTYSEAAKVLNKPLEWNWAGIRGLFSWPLPNKIVEIGPFAKRPYRKDRNPFFRDRHDVDYPEGSRDSSDSDAESDDTDYDNLSMASVSSNPARDREENRWIECAFFCIRQLFFSRLWIFLLQFIGAHWLGANNRFKTDAFDLMDQYTRGGNSKIGDVAIRRFFAGLRRWDAQHFLWITEHSYIFEKSLAFFPALPEIISTFSNRFREFLMDTFKEPIHGWVVTGALYILINHLIFLIAGVLLYLLVVVITRSAKKSMLAVSLFAFNPASIFFSAAYSESAYALMTFLGLFILICALRQMSWVWRIFVSTGGAALMSLSFLIRSNGILNCIFVGWYTMGALLWEPIAQVAEPTTLRRAIAMTRNERLRKEWRERLENIEQRRKMYRKVFGWTSREYRGFSLVLTIACVVSCTVYLFFQPIVALSEVMVSNFCNGNEFNAKRLVALKSLLPIPEDMVTVEDAINNRTAWCKEVQSPFAILPPYYSLIQTKYWDVGFMKYWQIKKIPCFLLMLPAAIITVSAILHSLHDVFVVKKWNNIYVLFGRSDHLVPFSIHAVIMLLSAVFFYNAEVYTRIIFSSTPFLYIYLAGFLDRLTKGEIPENHLYYYDGTAGILPVFVSRRIWRSGWKAKLLIIYFMSYFVLGTMAHAAWLPFT